MREKIYFLAKGNFTYEPPAVVVTPEKVEMEVVSGTKDSTTFTVSNARKTKLKGFGFVPAQEITFLPVFDSEENKLTVEVDASELIAGTKLTGKLILVTDCGETKVPYEINVVAPVLTDENGKKVSDYFTLMSHAEKAPKEGLKLFRDPMFRETFLYRDAEGQLVYDRLMKGNTGLSGMEEFLVAFGKKEPVRFMLEHAGEDVVEYELAGSDIEDVIMINLNAWGCTAIRVEVEGDFIEAERSILWTDEFSDMRGRLGFRIIAGRVSEGNHFGKITFTSPYESHSVGIYVHSPVGAKERKIGRAKQAVEAMLLRSILAYEEGRVTKEELRSFLQKHRSVLERLNFRYHMPLKGYMAWILGSEASKLEFYRDTERDEVPRFGEDQLVVENYLLTAYIKYLYSEREEEREELGRLVAGFSENGYMSPILLLLGLRCDREQYGTDLKRVERIREMLVKSTNSPMLYSELIKCYRREPELLTELDALNLRALLYALRQGLVTKEMADVITVLSEGRGLPLIDAGAGYGYTRENDPLRRGTGALLMRMLFGVYEVFPTDDILRNICSLLIRYEKRDRRYFPWYERGVEKMLRLTDLFEYYMYTVDPDSDEPLPQNILSYFQFENHLNDTRKAYLYANIVKNKEANPSAYDTYEPQIRAFVLDQLAKERVSMDLGYLYREMLKNSDITGAPEEADGQMMLADQTVSEDPDDQAVQNPLAVHLPHIMFRHLLTCTTPGIESVTLVYLNTTEERTYPLDRGKALLDIYTPAYRLFFSDREGNQYVESIDYTLERFMDGDDYAPLCYPVVDVSLNAHVSVDANEVMDAPESLPVLELAPLDVPESLVFHLAARLEKKPRLDDTEVDVLFRALATEKLRDVFHGRVFLRIYDYIRDQVREDERNAYLRLLMRYIKPDTIKRSRIGEVATDCIRCGETESAASMLRRFGRSGCGEKELVALTIERIRELDYEFEDCLVKWALQLYHKGHHDHPILNYLLQYYMGETDTLISLFRDSLPRKREGTGAAQLESFEGHIRSNPAFYESVRERLLGQVLFACRDTAETEDIFIKYYDDGENRMLVKAYLSQIAYEYIVGRGELPDEIFEKVYRQAMYERDPVMVLAALKKMVGRESYDEKETEFIERSLDDMAAEGCVLPFMKEFSGAVTVPSRVRTPVIVQYYSGTTEGVFLFVKNKKNEYESRPMSRVFDGIFAASLLLFAGEETVGYIYEEETGKRSKQFELRKREAPAGADSMFEQVNAMLEAKQSGDDEKYQSLCEQFITEQQLAKSLFAIL